MLCWGVLTGFSGGLAAQESKATAEELAARLMQLGGGKARLVYQSQTHALKYLGADPSAPLPTRDPVSRPESGPAGYETSARRFLASYGALFGIGDPDAELKVREVRSNGFGHFFVRLDQRYRGIPVFGGQIIVQLNAAAELLSVVSRVAPDIGEALEPGIPAEAASEAAVAAVGKWRGKTREQLAGSAPDLCIYNPALFDFEVNRNTLAWKTEVTSDADPQIHELILVRARDGRILLHFNQTRDALNRKIYDNQNNPAAGQPGWGPVRLEGQPPVDIADVDAVYNFMGDSYLFFQNVFGRDSIDGKGFGLTATVRYCDPDSSCPYSNAFWSGKYQQLFLGSRSMTGDTVFHELGHGFSDFTSNFYYFMQSGAIEESIADLWGRFVDLTRPGANTSPAVRWLMFHDDQQTSSRRSMNNPNLYDQPASTFDPKYYCGTSDQGGVHTNSGVGNKAAYLMTDGDTFNGLSIRGLGLEKTARIYYEYQQHLAVSGADFEDLHYGLQQACRNLVGNFRIVADDCEQVRLATTATGMTRRENWCVYPKAQVCSSGQAGNIFYDDLEGDVLWEKGLLSGNAPSYQYIYDRAYSANGKWSLYLENVAKTSDLAAALKQNVSLPADQNIYMHFKHSYQFEFEKGVMYDGGVLEYSLDEGRSWNDTRSMFLENGYDGTIHSGAGNPLAGRQAFTGTSFGYTASRLDISTLAGRSVRFRFRVGSDEADGDEGWYIDEIRIYTCGTTYLAGTPRGAIDRPSNNETLSGSVAVSGWAAVVSGSVAGPPKRLDLYVDEVPVRQLAGGVARPDVQNYFSAQGINAPIDLGYGGTWDSRSVADGLHQLSVRAADSHAVSRELVTEVARVTVRTSNGMATSTSTTAPGSTTTTTRPGTTTTSTVASTSTTLPGGLAEPATVLALATQSGQACSGFYIGDVSLARGARAGTWGIEILLTAGERLLQGGLNLGGAFEENGRSPAWGAFNIDNPGSEPQEVRVRVDAQPLATSGYLDAALGINLRILDANRNQIGSATLGASPQQLRLVLNPGFYIIEVKSLAGSPRGTFQLSAETGFVGRSGGGFQGGVVVGGHLARDAQGNSIHGYAAFCISEGQNVSFKTYGAPTYGSASAGNLVLAVKDAAQRIIWQSPNP